MLIALGGGVLAVLAVNDWSWLWVLLFLLHVRLQEFYQDEGFFFLKIKRSSVTGNVTWLREKGE